MNTWPISTRLVNQHMLLGISPRIGDGSPGSRTEWPSLEERAGEDLSAYCGGEPTALEAQARSCALPGATCAGAPRQLPSVERAAYDKGEWGEFRHEHCAVWFTRDAGKWRVVDGECDGD